MSDQIQKMIIKIRGKQKNSINLEKQTYLSVDIGTEYIKSVLYIIVDRSIEVIGYDRFKQLEASMSAAFIMNLHDVVDAVDKSIGKAVGMADSYFQQGYILPKEVIMGIAGELVQGATVLVNIDRENPEKKIDEQEIENIINKVKKHTFESTKIEIAEEVGIAPNQIQEIDTVINSAYIDSVKVANPVGFSGSELVYRVFSAFAPKIHIESINRVAKELNLELTKIVVQPYALSLALEGIREKDASAIFIDVGGGTTDIAMVHGGDIIGTKMFAIGGRVFTKRIMKDMDVDFEEAEQMKMRYSNSELLEIDQKQVKKAIKKDIPAWLTGVKLALQEFEDIEEFPSQIYLCGGGALLPDIQEELLSFPWLQEFKFKKFPKINFFFPNKVRNVVDKTRKATLPGDVTPLALARMKLENN